MQQARDYGDRCPTKEDSYHEPFPLVYPRPRSSRVLVSPITVATRRLGRACGLPGLTPSSGLLGAAPFTCMTSPLGRLPSPEGRPCVGAREPQRSEEHTSEPQSRPPPAPPLIPYTTLFRSFTLDPEVLAFWYRQSQWQRDALAALAAYLG